VGSRCQIYRYDLNNFENHKKRIGSNIFPSLGLYKWLPEADISQGQESSIAGHLPALPLQAGGGEAAGQQGLPPVRVYKVSLKKYFTRENKLQSS
jgi:hypothetical protein